MKKLISNLPLFVAVALILTFSSCKKSPPAATTLDDSVSAQDQATVSTALNASIDDASNTAGGVAALSGKTEGAGSVSTCGYTVDTTNKANGIIVINYNGDNCNGISRTGSITITLENFSSGTRWKDQGAVLSLSFTNVKVTNVVTSGYITLNGTHTLTNTTGGLAWKILAEQVTGTVSYQHQASSFTITFADGSIRTWSVDRVRTYSYDGSTITVSISSGNTEGSHPNVDMWGTNRNNESFYNTISQPITVTSANASCAGLWYNRPAGGNVTHYIANRSVSILYGVDKNGDPSGNSCPWGYLITYTKNNKSLSVPLPYWF